MQFLFIASRLQLYRSTTVNRFISALIYVLMHDTCYVVGDGLLGVGHFFLPPTATALD